MEKSACDTGPEKIKALVYVYIAQNVTAYGVLADTCPRNMLSHLTKQGLIYEMHRGGFTIVKTTEKGAACGKQMIDDNIEAFARSATWKTTNPIVVEIIRNRAENFRIIVPRNFQEQRLDPARTLPWANEKYRLGLLPLFYRTIFEECAKFSEQLRIAGLAVITQDYSIKTQKTRGEWYVFPKEIEPLLRPSSDGNPTNTPGKGGKS